MRRFETMKERISVEVADLDNEKLLLHYGASIIVMYRKAEKEEDVTIEQNNHLLLRDEILYRLNRDVIT